MFLAAVMPAASAVDNHLARHTCFETSVHVNILHARYCTKPTHKVVVRPSWKLVYDPNPREK